MVTTAGALIPDGYELYDDNLTPYICPIRSCRKLFRHMIALGAHFGVSICWLLLTYIVRLPFY